MSRGIFRFADVDLADQSPSPGLGEHNTEILENLLGISGETIKNMELEEIIGTVPLTGSDAGGSRRQT